mgnify:CR=1
MRLLLFLSQNNSKRIFIYSLNAYPSLLVNGTNALLLTKHHIVASLCALP